MFPKKQQQGFLLVEMLVAVFIFTIVMFVSITAVLALIDANKKNQSIKSVVNNLNLVVGSMAKNLAVGTFYYCGIASSNTYVPSDANELLNYNHDCVNGSSSITFTFNEDSNGTGPNPDVIRYKYVETDSVNHTGYIARSIDSTNNTDFIAITAPEVHVTSLMFYVFGTAPLVVPIDGGAALGDAEQPYVVMVVRGYAGNTNTTKSQFHIQTTVSQRSLDAYYKDI